MSAWAAGLRASTPRSATAMPSCHDRTTASLVFHLLYVFFIFFFFIIIIIILVLLLLTIIAVVVYGRLTRFLGVALVVRLANITAWHRKNVPARRRATISVFWAKLADRLSAHHC
jgi:hypothetical protein